MTAVDFEARIIAWAKAQPDIQALIQIGSRVQRAGHVDEWSDWDYHVITREPHRYRNRIWPAEIAPCWSSHCDQTERGVTKISAVFAHGLEADFVLLSAWQVRLICLVMRHPGLKPWLPNIVCRGVENMRLVVKPGYRVVLGGVAWERRYAANKLYWPDPVFSGEDLEYHVAGFWRHAVWVTKKLNRGELCAAMRWAQVELREHTYALLAEEARLAGRASRPEARGAERWLLDSQMRSIALPLAPSNKLLQSALLAEMALFCDLSRDVAIHHGIRLPDNRPIIDWIQAHLTKATS